MKNTEEERIEELSPWHMVLGPLMGLFYVTLLPFIAIGALLMQAGGKLLNGILGLAGKTVSFEWRPLESYLFGKKKRKRKGPGGDIHKDNSNQ